jgi:HEAT repeat protein
MIKVLLFFFLSLASLPLFADQNNRVELSNNDRILLNLLQKVVLSNDETIQVDLMNHLQRNIASMNASDRTILNLSVIKKISGLLANKNAYIRSSAARSLGDIGQAACSEKSSLENALYDEEHPSGVFKVFPSHGNESVLREAILKMHCN